MNVVVIRGVVLNTPVERVLGSGEYATSFDVVTESDEGRLTVPVNWVTTVKTLLQEGEDVMVSGSVRRRFYRAGGSVQSRTEVLAKQVLNMRRKVAVKKSLTEIQKELTHNW
jgi:hypothetical protein